MLLFTHNKKRLLRHFEKDPYLFAYHIGDLDDFFFPHCQWIVDYGRTGGIAEAILIFTGIGTPSVLAFGINERFDKLLEEALDFLPPKFYCHYLESSRTILTRRYRETGLGTHIKMKLTNFRPSTDERRSAIIRLDSSHAVDMKALYDSAYPGNYFADWMLQTGKYFGYLENDQLIAVAGVHCYSAEYNIATLGNIVTATEHRGSGLATLVTSHLVEELRGEGRRIGLNVKADNDAAIHCYEKLGFEKVCNYEEGLFER